ncbi:MAG: PspC domain-containing protein [Bacteroidia bacterium]|nr:PspC domain-containing protein [Bacteroidia bacterium]MCZ2277058.1 PspC domain-containing protein [Bacteroidia bacterium]
MKPLTETIKNIFEPFAFGVCDRLGEYMNIPGAHIRIFFIYASFITLGSPLIFYLILAFIHDLRKIMKGNRGSVWDM